MKDKQAAILCQYDNQQTYDQRFCSAMKKEEATVSELETRLQDLLERWSKDCDSVKKLRDLIVREQLLRTMPADVRIWVSESKPETSKVAAEMADSYLLARKQASGMTGNEQQRGERRQMYKGPR